MSPVHVTTDQRQKALRIYARALPLIADAIGVSTKALHNNVLRRVLFDDLAALESGPAVPPNDAVPVVPEIEPSGDLGDALPSSSEVVAEFRKNLAAAKEALAETKPEPAPMMQMRRASQVTYDERVSSGLVTLRTAAGDYLNMDGSGITINRAHAYRGTLTQARAMRKAKPIAASMKISHFLPRRPT